MKTRPLVQGYLERSASRLPDKVAIVCGDQRYTYAEIEADSAALARRFFALGVRRGDRVLVLAGNRVETVVAFFGALRAGAVASPVSPHTRADKLAFLLRDCEPAALVVSARSLPALLEAVERGGPAPPVVLLGSEVERYPGAVPWTEALADRGAAPDVATLDIDLASIIYTSGSTGEPKGVMLTHRNMLTAATSVSSYLDNRSDEVILCALPLSFDYGLYQVIMAFREGARVVIEPGFTWPTKVLRRMERERVTAFPGVPTMFALLAAQRTLAGYDLGSVRYVCSTAAALPIKHIRFLRDTFEGARIYSMYGLTECQRVSYLPPEDVERKPECVGRPIPNTEVWIVDDEGERLGPGEVGQLVVRGATVMAGYWRKPEATARRLAPGPLPGERVLMSGDLCRIDEEGDLYFVARMDDVIKSRGEKVPPQEVENALVDIEGVREAAVIGRPDEVLGQAIVAFVVAAPGATLDPAQIRVECRRRLEAHMVPAEIEIVGSLPHTASGKISRAELEAKGD